MTAVVIPALAPPPSLLELVRDLGAAGLAPIVVIDDGSPDRTVFDALEKYENVTVLRHEINRGKGQALKTGFEHVLAEHDAQTIVTADADGQHLADDIVALCRRAQEKPDSLVLGVRAFDEDVPWKSIVGNQLTRSILRGFYGLRVSDSQTGLRAIPRTLVRRALNISADRYAFELEMLLRAKEMHLPIDEVAIQTVYIDGNRASHFRPVRDSVSVYWVFIKFSIASLASFVVDISLFAMFLHMTDAIVLSTYAARVVSGTLNFLGNRGLVFSDRRGRSIIAEVAGYLALAVLIATASGLLVKSVHHLTELAPIAIKIGVDACLFLASFAVQRYVLFGRGSGR